MERGLRAKCNVVEDACLLSREEIYHALCQQDNIHRFIDNRYENFICKAPWDEIGITYAFDIFTWATDKYSYEHRIRWKDKF